VSSSIRTRETTAASRSRTDMPLTPQAPHVTQLPSNVALSNLSQNILVILQRPDTQPTRMRLAVMELISLVSRAYPYLGQTRSGCLPKLVAKVSWTANSAKPPLNWLITVCLICIRILILFDLSVFSVDEKVTPIWNTMAAIPGHIKDEVLIVGCHRDGTSFH
jgi:hypothetical protein